MKMLLMNRLARLICLLLVLPVGLLSINGFAAPPKAPKSVVVKQGIRPLLQIEKDYVAALTGDDARLKPGMKVSVYLQSGKRFEDVEITEVQPGKVKNSFKLLAVVNGKGSKQKIQPSTLLSITADDLEYDIVQDPSTKAYLALDLALRDEQSKSRLAKSGHSLWDTPSDDVRKSTIDDAHALFEKAKLLFPDHNWMLQETEFFLFYTDMPPDQIAGYLANLDAMYRQMSVAFGVLPGRNIWRGKCPVIAFLDADAFRRFEAQVMQNPVPNAVQGLHHGYSDGKVVITVYRGNDPAYFATVLVHETAHGFVHRLRSNVNIVPWLNEGIADWIAGVAVPASGEVPRRQSDAIAQMRSNGSMGGLFDEGKRLTSTDYGTASSLTQFMLQTDSNLYRAFLDAIKDGYSIEEALKLTYNCTPQELVNRFGQSLGIPDLRP